MRFYPPPRASMQRALLAADRGFQRFKAVEPKWDRNRLADYQ